MWFSPTFRPTKLEAFVSSQFEVDSSWVLSLDAMMMYYICEAVDANPNSCVGYVLTKVASMLPKSAETPSERRGGR